MGSSVATRRGARVGRSGDEPVPGYRLLERVGYGGAGEVWRAEAPGGLSVALKLIRTDGTLGRRELSNLRILRAVRHPNLLAYFGAWVIDGLLILGMELADLSLWDRYREFSGRGLAGIPMDELLGAMGEASRVLDYLHEPRHELDGMTGVAVHHRDVKPQNLMLLGRGLKVADFGLSILVDRGVASQCHSGLTCTYAAPETFRGRVADQTDQYSLAVTYCVLRAGRLPFAGPPAAVMLGHLMQPPDLSSLPEPERPIVARALAKDPSDRWPDCGQFVEALRSCLAAGSPLILPGAAEGEGALGEASTPPGETPDDSASQTGLVEDSDFWCGELGPEASAGSRGDSRPAGGPGADRRAPSSRSWRGEPGAEDSQEPTTPLPGAATDAPPPGGPRPRASASRWAACLAVAGLVAWEVARAQPDGGRRADVPGRDGIVAPGMRRETASGLAPPTGRPAAWAEGPPDPFESTAGTPAPIAAAEFAPVRPAGRARPDGPTPATAIGAEASRYIRLATAGIEAMRGEAGRLARAAQERLAANLPRRTADAGGTRPPAADRRPAPAKAPPPAKAAPSFRLGVPDTLEVDAGSSEPVPIVVCRGGASGPIAVRFEGLPAGVSPATAEIPTGYDRGLAALKADSQASPARATVRVVASAGAARAEATIALTVRANPAPAEPALGQSPPAGGATPGTPSISSGTVELTSAEPAALNDRGLAHASQGRLDAAVADYTAALRLSPKDASIRTNRGTARARQGDLTRASLDFETAIRLNPGHAPAYRGRALLREKAGDLPRASADRARADQLDRPVGPAGALWLPAPWTTPAASGTCYRVPVVIKRRKGP
ncbi:Serine/threonine-protein kinase PknF [Aquisphaera giovannonii]|uniref:Serine/threonine-protein kinase PknF n=1 Tax=Aquisphaera giovannonii TaxID=406548 RepID=A0A5B9W6B4_9BACT|nr:protein kinase [Aquisphaera giovannonii]QEH35699.1 Serine/threonine-protein kinase PknF [Aquisphaera giovannonii]